MHFLILFHFKFFCPLLRHIMVLFVQRATNHANAKRLPPLFRAINCDSPEEKSRSGSVSSSRNRSSADLGPDPEGHLGSAANRRIEGELPHFSHGGMASQEKTNRAQRLGKTGKTG